jgi:hypothetical protein
LFECNFYHVLGGGGKAKLKVKAQKSKPQLKVIAISHSSEAAFYKRLGIQPAYLIITMVLDGFPIESGMTKAGKRGGV